MRYVLSLAAVALFAMGCGNNVVSSTGSGSTGGTTTTGGSTGAGTTGGGTTGASTTGGSGGTTGAALPRPTYPPVSGQIAIGNVVPNFSFTGYLAATSGTRIDTNATWGDFDFQKIRNLVDANGKPYRYMLFDASAGWCVPCNDEAESFGLNPGAANTAKIQEWLSKGGLYVTVLVQGYNESSGAAPVQADVGTWLNQHNVQSSLGGDFSGVWMANVNQTAFPGNVIIDLDTMKIVDVFYGVQDQNIFAEYDTLLNQ